MGSPLKSTSRAVKLRRTSQLKMITFRHGGLSTAAVTMAQLYRYSCETMLTGRVATHISGEASGDVALDPVGLVEMKTEPRMKRRKHHSRMNKMNDRDVLYRSPMSSRRTIQEK